MMCNRVLLSILPLFIAQLLFATQGESLGVFSVSSTQKVHFSKGNLQFNAALDTHQCADGSTQKGTWRFALNQYDMIGVSANTNRSETYDGWIDTYSWGTSGWNSGAKCYQPWETGYDSEFTPGNKSSNDLLGDYAYADWGVYNAISNGGNKANLWRTLTDAEWKYLLSTRTNAEKLYFLVTLNNIRGLILLPDDWKSDTLSLPTNTLDINKNKLTIEEWHDWELQGAIFLPYTNYRTGSYSYSSYNGHYWSTSHKDSYNAYIFAFGNSFLGPYDRYSVSIGNTIRSGLCYVRLVRDVSLFTIQVSSNDSTLGCVSGGKMGIEYGDKVTLSATSNDCGTFLRWADGNTDNPRTVEVTDDATYTAEFTRQQYTLTAVSDNDEQGFCTVATE